MESGKKMLVVPSQVSVKLASASINKIGRYKMKLTSRQKENEKKMSGWKTQSNIP